MNKRPTICNICGGEVILINTNVRNARTRFIYKCTQCGASVGTHPKTFDALGTLADRETKAKRREVHEWFDNLYETHEERESLYEKLAIALGIDKDECHFGLMDIEMLERALVIIKKWWLEKFDR